MSLDPMTTARRYIEEALIERAGKDTAFRELLTANPRGALKSMLGVDPIPSYRINVIDEQPGEIVLVLPRRLAEDELPDELLDYASGGNAAECWRKMWSKEGLFKPIEGKGLF